MNAATPSLANLVQSAADWLFMPWVVVVLLGTGLFLTLRTGAVQVRRFSDAWRVAFVRRASGQDGALTPFQAFMTALAASIGTGNIAGVATAIVSGGPGALFWIWVYGFVAMAIKFAEAVLGVRYRETRNARNAVQDECHRVRLGKGRRRERCHRRDEREGPRECR